MIFEKIIEIAKYYDWESIFRGSLILLALNAPLDNYLSYISYAEICYKTINILPNIENPNHYKESINHSDCMIFLLDLIVSEKNFLVQTKELNKKIIDNFKYIYENKEDIFTKKILKFLNKSFDEILLDVYAHTILSLKTGG